MSNTGVTGVCVCVWEGLDIIIPAECVNDKESTHNVLDVEKSDPSTVDSLGRCNVRAWWSEKPLINMLLD